jgi:hypothetical protein
MNADGSRSHLFASSNNHSRQFARTCIHRTEFPPDRPIRCPKKEDFYDTALYEASDV